MVFLIKDKELQLVLYGLLGIGILLTAYAAFSSYSRSNAQPSLPVLNPTGLPTALPTDAATPTKAPGLLKVSRIVNSSCVECVKASDLQSALESGLGAKFSQAEELELSSSRGKELAVKYNLTKIPSLVITGEVDAYPSLKQEWPRVGTVESDGALVWRNVFPPYQELPSFKVKGIVTLFEIRDEKCSECYDVGIHEKALGKYGLRFGNITVLNYTQPLARQLASKYNLALIPTVLFDGEAKEYYPFTSLKQAWELVGSVEPDGWHVFRNVSALGANVTFRNLTSGKIETTHNSNQTGA